MKIFNMDKLAGILCTFFLLSLCLISSSQNVILYGNAITYSGHEIVFNRFCDLISGEEEEIGRCKVDSNGDFKISFDLESTAFIFSHLGVYKAFLYVEPDKKYEIILPEKTDKTPEDKLNPYFVESGIQLGMANIDTNELNLLIRIFNDAYIPFYNKHVINVVNSNDFSELDVDIEKIEKPFVSSTNKYFNEYREYRYGILRLMATQKKVKNISEKYFKDKPVLYDNPAYMELFNQVYNKYFMFFGRTNEGREIYSIVNRSKSYSELINIITQNSNFYNEPILELVILKAIYNEFYDSNFSRSGLLCILDSLMLQTKIHQHKLIGETIKTKITKLLSGYDPPAFELYDADSNLITLSNFKGKYVYLNFCTSSSYTCLGEFEILDALYERHKERLEIVTIAVDPERDKLKDFLKARKYKWKFLYFGNQPEILNEYDVRAYPTYFLIGPDGRLIFSPCPSPSENFESKLYNTMKERGDL